MYVCPTSKSDFMVVEDEDDVVVCMLLEVAALVIVLVLTILIVRWLNIPTLKIYGVAHLDSIALFTNTCVVSSSNMYGIELNSTHFGFQA